MSDSNDQRNPVEALAQQYVERLRKGENPNIESYCSDHPQWAEQIRALFPSLELMESFKPTSKSRSGASGSGAQGSPPIPERLGEFRLLQELGRGGMGIVYEAEQESLGRRVALKVLPPATLSSSKRFHRFQREVQVAAQLHHTNIVPIFGVGEAEGMHFYVMQHIEGGALEELIRDLRQNQTSLLLPDSAQPLFSDGYWQWVAALGIQIAEGLDHAHSREALHRDIKPGNVLIDHDGVGWIADFGLAKFMYENDLSATDITQEGDVVGTLRYMSPEQLNGESTLQSDVYALGVTLYELLTLRPVFDAGDRPRLLKQIEQNTPPNPRSLNERVPRDLETVVLKAMAFSPQHRYSDAGSLAHDLRRFCDGVPVQARRIHALERLRRWVHRNPALAGTSGIAILALLAAGIVGWIGWGMTEAALQRESISARQAQDATLLANDNVALSLSALEEIFESLADSESTLLSTSPRRGDPDAEQRTEDSVREAELLESVLSFYEEFAAKNATDATLAFEAARAHRRVAALQNRLGRNDAARNSLRKALTIDRDLVLLTPTPEHRVELTLALVDSAHAQADAEMQSQLLLEAERITADWRDWQPVVARACTIRVRVLLYLAQLRGEQSAEEGTRLFDEGVRLLEECPTVDPQVDRTLLDAARVEIQMGWSRWLATQNRVQEALDVLESIELRDFLPPGPRPTRTELILRREFSQQLADLLYQVGRDREAREVERRMNGPRRRRQGPRPPR